MHYLIWLKFGTLIWGLKVNTSIIFGINLFNIQGVTSDFTHKAKSYFCHAYSVTTLRKKLKISM